MTSTRIVGEPLPNLPWQPCPAGVDSLVWRHDGHPIIGWNPTPSTARIFNSAVVPFGDGFTGVFRADHRDGRPRLHVGRSRDGLAWEIEDKPIRWVDEDGDPYQPDYAYDPRGLQLTRRLPNQITSYHNYDDAGRLGTLRRSRRTTLQSRRPVRRWAVARPGTWHCAR